MSRFSFQVSGETFLPALSQASSVVPSQNALAAVTSVMLRVSKCGKKLSITSTNLEEWLETLIPVDQITGDPGEGCLVLCSLLTKLVASEKSSLISAERLENGDFEVSASGRTSALKTLSIEAFPDVETGELSQPERIDAEILSEALNAVRRTSSTDPTRYNINGVNFNKDFKSVVATDARIAAWEEISIPNCLVGKTISQNAAGRFAQIIQGRDEVMVSASDSSLSITSASLEYQIRFLVSDFPSLVQALRKPQITRGLLLDTTSLKSALDWLLIACSADNISNPNRDTIECIAKEGADTFEVKRYSTDTGAASSEVELREVAKEEVKFRVSAHRLLLLLSCKKSEATRLFVHSEDGDFTTLPIFIEAENTNWNAAIFPVRPK